MDSALFYMAPPLSQREALAACFSGCAAQRECQAVIALSTPDHIRNRSPFCFAVGSGCVMSRSSSKVDGAYAIHSSMHVKRHAFTCMQDELLDVVLAVVAKGAEGRLWAEFGSSPKQKEGSTWKILQRLLQVSRTGRLLAFDSFLGLPDAWEDLPKGAFATGGSPSWSHPRMEWHLGWFNTSLPRLFNQLIVTDEKISFLHVDCDLYASALEVFQYVAPLLAPEGCLVVLDEAFGGELQALWEVAAAQGWSMEVLAKAQVGPLASTNSRLALRVWPQQQQGPEGIVGRPNRTIIHTFKTVNAKDSGACWMWFDDMRFPKWQCGPAVRAAEIARRNKDGWAR